MSMNREKTAYIEYIVRLIEIKGPLSQNFSIGLMPSDKNLSILSLNVLAYYL